MTYKFPIRPDRVRHIPEQFSWVDQRLVRDQHIKLISHEAAALYLFLVTIADCQGLSYYSDPTISARLNMKATTMAKAREDLTRAELIAYKEPLYQVLALDAGCRGDQQAAMTDVGRQALAEIFRQLEEGAP